MAIMNGAVPWPSSSDCSCDQNSENGPSACITQRGFQSVCSGANKHHSVLIPDLLLSTAGRSCPIPFLKVSWSQTNVWLLHNALCSAHLLTGTGIKNLKLSLQDFT